MVSTHLVVTLWAEDGEPVSPDVWQVGTTGELVCTQVGQQDGVLLWDPVLHILNTGQTGPALQE